MKCECRFRHRSIRVLSMPAGRHQERLECIHLGDLGAYHRYATHARAYADAWKCGNVVGSEFAFTSSHHHCSS